MGFVRLRLPYCAPEVNLMTIKHYILVLWNKVCVDLIKNNLYREAKKVVSTLNYMAGLIHCQDMMLVKAC